MGKERSICQVQVKGSIFFFVFPPEKNKSSLAEKQWYAKNGYRHVRKQIVPRHREIMDNSREPVIHAKVFANQFHELCTNFRAPIKDSNEMINLKIAKCNESIIDFLVRIKSCMDRGRCDAATFINQVMINSLKLLEIELWWYLLRCGIMNQEHVFYIFDSSDFRHITKYFCQHLCRNILYESTDSCFRKNMNSDFIKMVLDHNDRCKLQDIHSPAYIDFLKCVSSQNITDNGQEIINIDSLVEISLMTSVRDSVIKSFLLNFIEVLLQGNSMTLEGILNISEHYIKDEKVIVKKNLKIFQFLDSADIITNLKQIFLKSEYPMHWKNLFYFVSLIATHCKENLKHFKSLISVLLEDALQNLNKISLLYAFILSRQCSSKQVPDFPSYANWFSSTFSVESSRPINTNEKAIFLMNFLNETVQYDSCYYLKVHINRAPCLPPDCQFLRSDYIKLVKTKLLDLNETAELGLFDNVITKTSAEFDVETVLEIYSSTNEVPKCVLEASLFSKSYYEKKFLVTLLSHNEGKSSVRHRFITKLHSLGKIPENLFVSYKLKTH